MFKAAGNVTDSCLSVRVKADACRGGLRHLHYSAPVPPFDARRLGPRPSFQEALHIIQQPAEGGDTSKARCFVRTL